MTRNKCYDCASIIIHIKSFDPSDFSKYQTGRNFVLPHSLTFVQLLSNYTAFLVRMWNKNSWSCARQEKNNSTGIKSTRGPFTMVRAFTVNSWNLVFFKRCFNIYQSRCRFEKKWYRWRQRSMHRYQISSSLIMICEKMYIWFARQLLLVFIIFKDFSTGLSDC